MIGRPWLRVSRLVAARFAKVSALAVIAGVSVVVLTTSAPLPTGTGPSAGAGTGASAGTWPAARRFFTINGFATVPLGPAVTSPVELLLTNPHSAGLTVTTLIVQIGDIRPATGRGACGRDNFVVHQFSGRYGFVIGAGRTTRIGDLGIAATQWPQLTMRDLPVNQDSCKGAILTLRVTGEAAA